MTRQSVLWSVGALLGIVCTAAVAWSASLLAGRHIGLSGVPLSAAGGLAPKSSVRVHKPAGRQPPHPPAHPTAVLPVPARSQPTTGVPTVTSVPAPSASAAPAPAGPAAPTTTGSSSAPAASGPTPHEDGGGGAPGGGSDSRQRDD